MPLTHVRVWEPKTGYRPVEVEEASLMYPYETVPADCRSRFVCELCAQNVGFTKPRKGTGTRHFYHSRGEQDKDCEDRAQIYGYTRFSLSSYVFPIRIWVKGHDFGLKLGFVHPTDRAGFACDTIRICGDFYNRFEFSFERIETSGITYLDIGNYPCQKYSIAYDNASNRLLDTWPDTVLGINPMGTLFECPSGRMLNVGAKAYPDREYYLVQRVHLSLVGVPAGIRIQKITEVCTPNLEKWSLYKLRVESFTEAVAYFFLQRSIFLTEKPTVFYPIWPPYVEDPYFIYYRDNDLYFFMQGENAELKTFPVTRTSITPLSRNIEDGKLYRIFASSKEQLLSLGASGALGFSYLMKKELDQQASAPEVSINNLNGAAYADGIYDQLPKSKVLTVSAPFDGKVVVKKNGKICFIYRLSAGQDLTVDQITFGVRIDIFQGCDLVQTLRFVRKTAGFDVAAADKQLAKKLKSAQGTMITVPHSIGAIAVKLNAYPQTRQWLLGAIRSGEMPRSAYRMLIQYSQEINHET